MSPDPTVAPLPVPQVAGLGDAVLAEVGTVVVGMTQPLRLALAAILQALYTYAPGMHRLVGSAPLGAGSWARILLAAVLVLGAAEAIKARSAPDGKEAAGR